MLRLRNIAIALLLTAVAFPAFAEGICPTGTPYNKLISGTSYTIGQADNCLVDTLTSGSAIAVTLPAPGTAGGFTAGFEVVVFASGAGAATITPSAPATGGTTPTINGSSSLVIGAGKSARITVGTDGNYYAASGGGSPGTLSVANGGTGDATLTAHAVLLGEGTSAVASAGPGTTGQLLVGATGADPAWGTPNSNTSKPSNPSATGSTAGVMMGLGGQVTPATTGRVMFIVTGDVINNTGNDGVATQLAYGTGTAPTNGAAAAGTNLGNPVKFVNANSTTEKVPVTVQGIVTGLTLGTGVWIDLNLAAITGGSATIADVTISAHEF